MSNYASQLDEEQAKADAVYARLDELRATTRKRLGDVRAAGGHGSPTQRAERDSFATMYENRLTQLRGIEDRLLFGRLDTSSGERRYIGRIGLSDANHESMLTDWRAEAARPFYEATATNHGDIVMRRHITLSLRKVTAVEDEVLDVDSDQVSHASQSGTLTGEGALLASLSSRRTGKMTDIVATIQGEQDRIIRAGLNSVQVVQGGPGTGKTAVALHRAAYLLYTHRRKLERSGVLVVGPSPAFLHYIDQVLPSLGETGVLSRTIETLLPGIRATGTDTPRAAKIKGDANMSTMVANAVSSYQRVPADLPVFSLNGVRVPITAQDIDDSIADARRTRQPHNKARVTFVKRMIERLANRYVNMLDYAPEAGDVERARDLIRSNPAVKRTLNLAWLPLTAQWLLDTLWSTPRKLRQCAPWLSDRQIGELYRPKGSPVTRGDVPILDEIMDRIGPDPNVAASLKPKNAEGDDIAFAKAALAQMGVDPSLVSAEALADAMGGGDDTESLAARAAQDRGWRYGHIVVDEAQELTRMEWKMLLRRCPSHSMTIVGDIAQTSTLGGARDWSAMLDPTLGKDGWNLNELTIDYRNPREVARTASEFARSEGLYVSTVKAVRDVPGSLERVVCDGFPELVEAVCANVADLAKRFVGEDGSGRVAVIATDDLLTTLRAPLWKALERRLGPGEIRRLTAQPSWDEQVSLTTCEGVKGLEYDAVVLVEPGEIENDAANRLVAASDLYVALTRPTQRLVIVKTRRDADDMPL